MTSPLLKTLFFGNEARLGRLATALASNERLLAAAQTAVTRILAARGAVDRGVASMREALHAPSTRDVRMLQDRVEELERLLESVDSKVSGLATRLDPRPPSP